METEADWMKKIPSSFVCNYFYVFYVVYAIIAVVTLVGAIILIVKMSGSRLQAFSFGFQSLLMIALAGVQALFLYLICDRALKPGMLMAKKEERPELLL